MNDKEKLKFTNMLIADTVTVDRLSHLLSHADKLYRVSKRFGEDAKGRRTRGERMRWCKCYARNIFIKHENITIVAGATFTLLLDNYGEVRTIYVPA